MSAQCDLWRRVDEAWYRAMYPAVEDWLAAGTFASPEDAYRRLGQSLGHDPNPYFAERWYLARYRGVRDAVSHGGFASGFDHFRKHGPPDFVPHWLFDPAYYRGQFERHAGRPFDVALDGYPYDHFLLVGQHTGLSGHRFFDATDYAMFAPFDLQASIRQIGAFTTYLLHVRAGGTEPSPTSLFDAAWYRGRYPGAGIDGAAWICALHHYLANDEPTRFDPSPHFSEAGYLGLHTDIRVAVERGDFRNGYEHFIRHGRAEGRFFVPAAPVGVSGSFQVSDDPGVTTCFALQTRWFETVTLLPIEADPQAPGRYTFGVFGSDAKSLTAFGHPWLDDRPSGTAALAVIQEEAIYGGILMNHFSHVLRDSLARLWFIRQRPDLLVLWHWIDLPVAHDRWFGWIEAIWQMLGMDTHRQHVIRTPVMVERLVLPSSGLPAPNTLHPLQANALARQPPISPWRGRRIWLSRHALPDRFGRMVGEGVVEGRLTGLGWTVICPEGLPVRAQADLFATEAVVAGFIGSAFHAALLTETPRAALILVTRPLIDRTFYDAVAQARGLRQVYVEPVLQPISDLRFWGSYGLANAELLADIVHAHAHRLG
jgi:hypothetical protein